MNTDTPPSDDSQSRAPTARPRPRRAILMSAGLFALGVAGWFAYDYFTAGLYVLSTDDAYVAANIASIAPRVGGQVISVEVEANQMVKKGQILARLDDSDYQTAANQAEARMAALEATIQRAKAQTSVAEAAVAQAQAGRRAAEADQARAAATWERVSKLNAGDFASRAALDNARADRDRAEAQLASATAGVASANAQRQLVEAQMKEAVQAVAEIGVTLEKARRDVNHTTIIAPMDGVIAARSAQVGEMVPSGKRLFSLVPVDDVFVDANFKETQVAKIAPGMPVRIKVDAYGGKAFDGVVESVAAGTGATFSMLPPDNATGNFTKIVQRVPVRIRFSSKDGAAALRAGLSAVVEVNTRQKGQ